MAAELLGKPYDYLLDDAHSWSSWAVPKTADGTVDHNTAVTGDDLIAFVNTDLFPYLKRFTDRASRPDTIEYKIGAIFSEIENKFRSATPSATPWNSSMVCTSGLRRKSTN